MSLRLYDTAARAVRDFEPLVPGHVGIYVCGDTVQALPHVGHARSKIAFDILVRWLRHCDFDVTYVRNVTDIDDKILRNAEAEGVPWWALAARNERLFAASYAALGCVPPTAEPRATGHVGQMVELIDRIVTAGHGYAAGGDVYFDVGSFAPYGALSGQDPAQMITGETAATAKRGPRDFTLWKSGKPHEPGWNTPWGRGRPGWHLECSAMATYYLGAEFDIHGGGLDLVFPHHENEIAQSRAAGDGFARYWMHNSWVTQSGEKMSKSLGNFLLVSEVLTRTRPVVLRYYLAAAHYRSTVDFSDEAMAEAESAYGRIEGFVDRAVEMLGDAAAAAPDGRAVPADFATAMDDDLGTPGAFAAVHHAVRQGNTALADGDRASVAGSLARVRAMLDVLGLDPLSPSWRDAGSADGSREVVDALVQVALEQRRAARERQDYGAADAIRDSLAEAGVGVEDTPNGPRWTLTGRG